MERTRFFVIVLMLFLSAPSVVNAQSSCDCWIQPDASYTLVNNNDWMNFGFPNSDDGSIGPFALPFNFDLYGQLYSQFWINTNGCVSFDQAFATFTAVPFPSGAAPPAMPTNVLVAPFWGDVDLGGPGAGNNEVYYKITPTALYVNWVNVGFYNSNTALVNTFQLIITNGLDPVVANGANVSFCYKDMQWTTGDASGGTGGFGGTPATVGANKGDGINYLQFGQFDQPGNAYDGPFGANDGVDWLDDILLTFATDSASGNVPPIVASQSVCDTLFAVCVGDVVDLDASFIAPEPTQTTVANSTAPTLSNYTIVSNTNGLVADIVTQFTPTLQDTGFHTITFTGTDNGSPVLTSTVTVAIEVLPGAQSYTDVLDLCTTDAPVTLINLFPNLSAGGSWQDSSGVAFSGVFDPAVDVGSVFTYTDTASGNCSSTGEVTVTVFPAVLAGSDTAVTYCSSEPAINLFTLLGANAQIGGQWINPLATVFNGTFDPSVDVSGAYCYIIQGGGPCTSDTACVNVTVIPVPEAGLDATVDLCANATIQDLFASLGGAPDTGGVWLDPTLATATQFFDASTNLAGDYTYVVSSAANCPPDSATVTVNVSALPNAGMDNTLALCEDAAVTNLFTLLGTADSAGVWTDPLGAVSSGSLNPAGDSSGTYLYVVTGLGQCGNLTDSATVDVALAPVPIASFTVDSTSSCVPLPVNFTNTTDSVYLDGTCSWNFGDGGNSTNCSAGSYTYSNAGTYTVSLTITTAAGCANTATATNLIDANEAPTADFAISPNPANVNNTTVEFTATSPFANQWDWDLASFSMVQGVPSTQFTFPNNEGGEYLICLNVADQFGCVDTSCQTLIVQDPLQVFVPNAFTANGDGLNEGFRPVITGLDPSAHEFYVFDRWGGLVFETNDPNLPWLGAKNNSGELLPSGVYVWRLIARGFGDAERKEYIGHVTLLR